MDDYGLYVRNRQRIRWIGSKAKGVVCNRYTFALFFLSLCLPPVLNLITMVISGVVFTAIVFGYREQFLTPSPYREDMWSSIRRTNHQLAYLYLLMAITSFTSNAFYAPIHDELDVFALLIAVFTMIYCGLYITHAIGIYEYRYKKESR